MARVEDYRAYAKQHFVRAQEADSEELRRASLEMASYWMERPERVQTPEATTLPSLVGPPRSFDSDQCSDCDPVVASSARPFA